MLDIKLIRENPDAVRQGLASRASGDETALDDLIALDKTRRELMQEVESLKAERNKASKEIGGLVQKGEDPAPLKARMKEVSARIGEIDKEVAELDEKQTGIILRLPNLPHESTPVGSDESGNIVRREEGKPPKFDFDPKPHWELGADRGLIDLERASKLSGSGFILYTGKGARLERALINYMLDVHTEEHGYTEISPPFIVRGSCMQGTGQLPKFAEDMYGIEQEDLFLVPTAEVPVTNIHADEILPEADLPKKFAAYTPCFRREAGSAGKDTRGMIRVHQFDKVELVHVVKPEDSYAVLDILLGHAERILKDLELTYRVLELCTADIGFSAAKCYDLEVWAPGTDSWLEVSSCSNFEDFQARRMKLRYKNKAGKNVLCHTLNGSGTALARVYIALLETHQQADGSIKVPKKLQKYLGTDLL